MASEKQALLQGYGSINVDVSELENWCTKYLIIAIKSKTAAVQSLGELKRIVENTYIKSRGVRIGGLSCTIVGSFVALIGFGLSFVTFGPSLGIIGLSALLSATGAIIIGCAEVWYMTVARAAMSDSKTICEFSSHEMGKLQQAVDEMQRLSDPPPSALSMFSLNDDVSKLVHKSSSWKPHNKPFARSLFCGCKVLDGIADVTLTAVLGVTRITARSGVQISVRTLWRELGLALKAVGIAAGILDIIFIPLDICVLIVSAVDVYKFKRGKRHSNSRTARKITHLIEEFERQRRDMERFQDGSTFHTGAESP